MSKANQIDENVSCLSDDNRVSLLVYGDSRFDNNKTKFNLINLTYIYFVDKDFRLPFFKVIHELLF